MQDTHNEEVQLETRERHEPSKPLCTQLTSACEQIPNISSVARASFNQQAGVSICTDKNGQ